MSDLPKPQALQQRLRLPTEQLLCAPQVAFAYQAQQSVVGGAGSGEAVFDGLPSTSSGLVGSSIQAMSNSASWRIQSIAGPTSQR